MQDLLAANTPKLGFGLMRLPKKPVKIDVEQAKEMVDLFMSAGFTYFDTAYVYLGSEAAARKALVERYPRESYTLADKLNAGVAPTAELAKRELATSLRRTGAGYFDYYLLHAIMENNAERYEKYGLWDYVQEAKAKGLVKHVGFSFHAGPELLDKILTRHPETEFVQLQLNYADWEDPKISSRANYEVARAHGKPVVIMEPVKGGKLADPPAQVKELMRAYAPTASFASWAIRYAASLEGVLTVLSGMSNTEQMRDNLSFMQDFTPLNAEELQIIAEAQRILGNETGIACTACSYCTAGCPKNINIPAVFAAMNLHLTGGQTRQADAAYAAAVSGRGRADECIACRACEKACPQHLPIADLMQRCAGALGKEE